MRLDCGTGGGWTVVGSGLVVQVDSVGFTRI